MQKMPPSLRCTSSLELGPGEVCRCVWPGWEPVFISNFNILLVMDFLHHHRLQILHHNIYLDS